MTVPVNVPDSSSQPASGPREVSDVELLRRVALGAEQALRDLWARYGRAVFGVCHVELRDVGAAEDATQETFLKIWRRADQFDPRRGTAPAWILTVARNSARNIARVVSVRGPSRMSSSLCRVRKTTSTGYGARSQLAT